MAVVINTNSSASYASLNLTKSSDLLQKSLARLSSGSKISTPSDDAGGLAVSMKLQAAIKRTDATATNVANALSFLQTQAGSLKSIASVLDRMSELGTLAGDVTKSTSDIANYSTEYNNLVTELGKLSADQFNGIGLFSGTASSLTVFISQDGAQTMAIDQAAVSSSWSMTRSNTACGLRSLTSRPAGGWFTAKPAARSAWTTSNRTGPTSGRRVCATGWQVPEFLTSSTVVIRES